MSVRILCLLSAAALTAGCGREAETAAKNGQPAAAALESNVVSLEPAAQKRAGVVVETVRLRSVPVVLRSPARFTPNENETWRVGAATDGRVMRVYANPGDRVAPGQVLARLHSHEIHESRAEYQKAVAELARTRDAETYARGVRDRARRLYQIKAASLEQVEHAESGLRNAETSVKHAELEVDRTLRHLTEFLGIPAEGGDHGPGELDEQELIPVRSPAAGTLLTRSVTPGTVVSPASEMFTIADLSMLWAIAEVNEEHLSKLREGMPVQISVQAYGDRSFAGRIGKLGETLDPATRTVRVRVEVPNRLGLLKPEMYASAEIKLGGTDSGLFVPAEASQEVRGQTVVFVRKSPSEFEVRPVRLGPPVGGAVQVLSGLRDGEAVVSLGSFILKSEFLKSALAEED